MAANHLVSAGFTILETNWRYSHAEIDIIAKDEGILVFIEVKTRSYDFFGKPEESIDAKKEALLQDAAQRYMEKIEYDWEIRFDVISIILDKSGSLKNLEHFRDVFFS